LDRIKSALANFNGVFGDRIVSSLKPLDLEDYQEKRQEAGRAPATIDLELVVAKTMVTKAFDKRPGRWQNIKGVQDGQA